LLSNPLLKSFEKVLFVRRKITHKNLGLPANWEGNSSLPTSGWDNEIACLTLRDLEAPSRTVYRPEGGRFVGDLRLHYHGDRLLFSQPGHNGRWQVFEMALPQGVPVELKLINEPDVDNPRRRSPACPVSPGRPMSVIYIAIIVPPAKSGG
jgi:hypothetical protein